MSRNVIIEINSRQIPAVTGDNLLNTALEAGIDIPHLCYHPTLSPTGACRLCMVKIEGRNGLIMSCTVVVEEGMKITTSDEEIEAARRLHRSFHDCETLLLVGYIQLSPEGYFINRFLLGLIRWEDVN